MRGEGNEWERIMTGLICISWDAVTAAAAMHLVWYEGYFHDY